VSHHVVLSLLFGSAFIGVVSCKTSSSPVMSDSELAFASDPRSVDLHNYLRAAAAELHSKDRNYCFADDMCYNRATAMLFKIKSLSRNNPDLRGPDKTWCLADEMPVLSKTGRLSARSKDCDDLAAKVVLRYPAGAAWSYHIATAVKTDKGWMTVDPIGSDLSPRTPSEWCDAWAHGSWEVGDSDDYPSTAAICELAPGNQNDFTNGVLFDPYVASDATGVKRELADHACALRDQGEIPSAPYGTDRDHDGIPNKEDLCPDTPSNKLKSVEYCNQTRYGCAKGEIPSR
jgi:hypothetical protein